MWDEYSSVLVEKYSSVLYGRMFSACGEVYSSALGEEYSSVLRVGDGHSSVLERRYILQYWGGGHFFSVIGGSHFFSDRWMGILQ